jgi:hypothetical protein
VIYRVVVTGALGDRVLAYGGSTFYLSEGAGSVIRGITATATVTSTGTTAMLTPTYRHGTFEWDGANQLIRVNNGAAEDTDASVHASYLGTLAVSLGAISTASNASQADVLGWAITARDTGVAALDATQRAELRAFFQYHCGVA